MARVNKCRVCLSTDPASGWAGTNHNLCNECVRVASEAAALERERARFEAIRAREEWERANQGEASQFQMIQTMACTAALLSR